MPADRRSGLAGNGQPDAKIVHRLLAAFRFSRTLRTSEFPNRLPRPTCSRHLVVLVSHQASACEYAPMVSFCVNSTRFATNNRDQFQRGMPAEFNEDNAPN